MPIIKKGNINLEELEKKFKTFKKRTPVLIANEARNHFLQGFDKGGKMTDASRSGWKPRKRERKKDRGRPILVKIGDTRADIQKRRVSFEFTSVGTRNIPYAAYLNDGTEKMPQREFIGDSKELEKKIENIINKELEKVKP